MAEADTHQTIYRHIREDQRGVIHSTTMAGGRPSGKKNSHKATRRQTLAQKELQAQRTRETKQKTKQQKEAQRRLPQRKRKSRARRNGEASLVVRRINSSRHLGIRWQQQLLLLIIMIQQQLPMLHCRLCRQHVVGR